jgi:tetratricopeptide (TPR) repeat protein
MNQGTPGRVKCGSKWRPLNRVSLTWVSLTVGLLLLSSGFSSLSAQAQTGSAAVQQGYGLLDRGWVNDAIAVFRQALQSNPQSVDARLGLAIAYQRAGQDANAWTAYQQVLTQDPNNRKALVAVGTLGSYRSEWQQRGIAALTTLLNLSPADNAARAQRALLYGYQGQFAAALADYQVVLSGNPTPDVLLGAAQIYTYSGDYPQGLALFNRYRATGASVPNTAITAYALALQKTGNPGQAVQILAPRLQSLRTLDETAIQIRSALAIAYQANQQPEQALAVLEPLRNQPEAELALARAFSTIGRQTYNGDLYEQSVALYRRALQRTPNPSAGLLLEIADVFSESDAMQADALQLYQQLSEQQPQNQSVQIKRLILENQLGQLSRADLTAQLQPVLSSLPTAPGERRSLAQALLRLDPPDPAYLSLYQTLFQEETDQPFFNFRIAQIYLQQNDLTQARQALSAYTHTPLGELDPASDLLLAEVERRDGNLETSARLYEAIIDRGLGDEIHRSAVRGLAGIRLAQGQPNQAIALYDQLLAANPDDGVIQLGRASVAYQTQQTSQAQAETVLNRWLTAHANAEPPPELFSLVGALPAEPQRESLYKQLLAIEPDNIAVNRRWVQLLAVRDPAEAKTQVEQLIARNPNRVEVYFVQGELAQTLGDWELASQSYNLILAAQPNNSDALSALGGVRFQQRKFTEATALYNRVLALKPNDLETRRILAELSAAQDQPLSALDQFQQIQQAQKAAATPDPRVDDRIRDLEVDFLRRRGFQPYWERY